MTPEEKAAKERELKELELQQLEEEEAAEQQQTAKPVGVGALESFGRGVAETLSPIAKYGEAAGIKARTAYEDIARGKPSFGVPYSTAVETAEEMQQASKKEQPSAYYGGMATGILGSGVAGARAAAPSLLESLFIGAGTGAAYGAGAVPFKEARESPSALGWPAFTGAAVGTALPLALGGAALRKEIGAGYQTGVEEMNKAQSMLQIPKIIAESYKATKGAIQEPAAMREVVQQIAKRPQAIDPMTKYIAQQTGKSAAIPPQSIPQESILPKMPAGQTIGERIMQGPSITQEEQAQFLLNLLQSGKTPAKEFLTQKATQLYPGQIGLQQLEKVLNIPLAERVRAREFDPSAMGKLLQPQAEEAKKALGKSGQAFKELQELASQEYKRTGTANISRAINLAKGQYDRPGTSALARNTVDEIDMIINEGSALPRYGVSEGPLKSANAQEVYKRFQAAREYADRAIRKNPQDLSIQDVLMPLRDQLDEVLKSSPSKVIADTLYSKGKQVSALGIKPLEMPIGDKKTMLSGKAIQEALGDTQKGEKLARGIEEARAFTQQFGEQLGPQESAKIDKFFNALADARSVADQKRILDSAKFAEGPSGSAIRAGIERLSQTIKPAPSGADMFRAAPEYLQSVDAFMADQAAKRFGKSYDQLTGKEQLKLVNMFQWFKENPNATMSEIESKFQTILRGTKK